MSIDNGKSATIEVYDTLSDYYTLLSAITNNYTLNQFSFVKDWHVMKNEEKVAKYSKFGCHEFDFFLYHRSITDGANSLTHSIMNGAHSLTPHTTQGSDIL